MKGGIFMKLKAVLGIKIKGSNRIRNYRIVDEQGNIRDIPISNVKEVLQKGINIDGLSINSGNVLETTEIPKISELGFNSISLEDWCLQNGDRGQRIINEFNQGNNFPITAKDITHGSDYKAKFRCNQCKKINIQTVNSKTSTSDSKCKYCTGQKVSEKNSLLSWCKSHGEYGELLLQEFIDGDNDFKPDEVTYASTKYANFKCSTCGNISRVHVRSKTAKTDIRCKYCDKKQTSFGEQLIFLWLQSQGFEVYNHYKFQTYLGTKEFDIYVPELNLVIEHQSGMHTPIEKQLNDDKTWLIVQELGINFLEVCLVSSNYQRQESNWCITYKLNHGLEMINKLSLWLNTNYGLNTNPTYPRALEDQVYLNSCKVKYEQSLAYHNPPFLKEWNYELNYPVTPDKVALNSNRKYYWTCPICGHIYLSAPNWRTQGKACPNYRKHSK